MSEAGDRAQAPIRVGPPEIIQVVDTIWATMFKRPIAHSSRVEPADGDLWTGCVHIRGPWCGTVHVRLTVPLATRLAGRMFDLAEDELSLDEVSDAVGEVANMTGGNLKTLMAYPATLSTPEVVLGDVDLLVRRGGRTLYQLAFFTEGEPFIVTVLECG